ncbi:MAG: hypothetical protein HY403_07670 [Elusimicrobia bacterium]|nr:hypothetical protein [Elusimicrobiota bacterium]
MTTLVSLDGSRRKLAASAIARVLSPAQMTMARQLMAAEKSGRPAPQPEEILFWLRLNMPGAAERIDAILHPGE